MNNYQLPEQLKDEINDLALLIKKYDDGKISAGELKAHRVPFGIYEQRKPDIYIWYEYDVQQE